jgi:release factor glutamine methyltransferase
VAAPESRPTEVLGVLRAAEKFLRAKGSPSARLDAELILASVLARDRLGLYLVFDRPMDAAELQRSRELVARRARGEPVAYLLGHREFFGLRIEVTPDVLIPRPETEHLVEQAIALLPQGARALDLGTGSGAIAVALAAKRPDVTVLATDVSAAALGVAQRNAAAAGVTDRVAFRQGSWWEAVPVGEAFDLVVSNPPYVDLERPELLADAVRRYEPALALFGPRGDALGAYRAIAAGVQAALRPDGLLLLEVGVDTAAGVVRLLETAGLRSVAVVPDLAGLPRVVSARAGA